MGHFGRTVLGSWWVTFPSGSGCWNLRTNSLPVHAVRLATDSWHVGRNGIIKIRHQEPLLLADCLALYYIQLYTVLGVVPICPIFLAS